MSVSDADIAFALDLFRGLGDVTHRKMFGGLGLYRDGAIFAVVSSEGRIYLKAQGEMAAELQSDGAEQFHNMPYWSLSEHALDDPESAVELAQRTIASLN